MLTGRLLVATPQIEEGVFHRSVVLILDHSDSGAQGVVLNRPLGAPVDSVLPGWQELATQPDHVFHGGPVQTDSALGLVAVPGEGQAPMGVRRLFGGIGVVDLDAPPPLVASEVGGLRIFAGYAGWTAGQLEGEIRTGSCMSSRPRPATPSPTARRTCGSACSGASATSWPSSRRIPRTPR